MDEGTDPVTRGNKPGPIRQHAWALGCAVGTKLITFQLASTTSVSSLSSHSSMKGRPTPTSCSAT